MVILSKWLSKTDASWGLLLVDQRSKALFDALDDIENLVLPIDLLTEFELNLVALQNWNNFPKSAKRGILEWLFNAKKNETRQKRIKVIIENSLVNKLTNFPNK